MDTRTVFQKLADGLTFGRTRTLRERKAGQSSRGRGVQPATDGLSDPDDISRFPWEQRLMRDPSIEVSREAAQIAREILRRGSGYIEGKFPSWFSGQRDTRGYFFGGFFAPGMEMSSYRSEDSRIDRIKALLSLNIASSYVRDDECTEDQPVWLFEEPTAEGASGVNVKLRVREASGMRFGNVTEVVAFEDYRGAPPLDLKFNVPESVVDALLSHKEDPDITRQIIKAMYPDLIATDFADYNKPERKVKPRIQLYAPTQKPRILDKRKLI